MAVAAQRTRGRGVGAVGPATSLAWNEITRQLYVIDLYFTCVGSVGWREAERSASVNNGEAESARGMGCAWVVPGG